MKPALSFKNTYSFPYSKNEASSNPPGIKAIEVYFFINLVNVGLSTLEGFPTN